MWIIATVTQGGAAMAAIALSRRRDDHRPIAHFLIAVAIASLARAAILTFVLGPAREGMRRIGDAAGAAAAQPFTGGALLGVYADTALWLIWPAGLTWATCAIFTPRTWIHRMIVGLYLGAAIGVASRYPAESVRGARLAQLYLAAELIAVGGSIASIVNWIWRAARPQLPHVVMLLLVASSIANLIGGAWRRDIFTRWHLAQAQLVVTYLVIFALEVRALWAAPDRRAP